MEFSCGFRTVDSGVGAGVAWGVLKFPRIIVCGLWLTTACSEAVELEAGDIDFRDGLVCEPTATEEDRCEDELYRHPFIGVELIDGKIPGLDLKDASPTGRYAVHEEGWSVDGNHHEFSGIAVLERRTLTTEDRAALQAEKTPRTRENAPIKIGTELAEAVQANNATTLSIEVALVRPNNPTFTNRFWRAAAEGQIVTRGDVPDAVAAIRLEMQQEIAEIVNSGAAKIEAAGGVVVSKCRNGHCLLIEAAPSEVEGIAALPEIARLDLPIETSNASVYPDGILMNEVYQTQQFWDAGYDGENGAAASFHFAIVENYPYNDEHLGYKESGGGGSRVSSMWDCSSSGCTGVSGWSPVDPTYFHPTVAAGTVFGDFTDNQQAGLTDAQEEARSAVAREAWAHLYQIDNGMSGVREAWDNINDRAAKPMVVSNSITAQEDQSCDGESTWDVNVDDLLYEQGILMFAAAGNSGHSSTDCRVWAPGAAAGAFTVGSYADEGNLGFTDECDARAAVLSTTSSSGGCQGVNCYTEGKYRTIIDIVGFHRLRLRTGPESDTDTMTFSGTSCAAPSVAGAAIALHDMWTQEHSSFMDYNPGYMAVWMLAMGDRYSGLSGFDLSSRFDNYSGAGRLRMRNVSDEGMDDPWYWIGGSTCVDDGEIVTIPINSGSALSSDVDDIVANIWWYDRRLETGDIDDVDLYLRTTSGTLLNSSPDDWDNKERVYYDGIGGLAVKLEIDGADVTSDDEGCGTDSMRVYYSVLIEDDDRDDANGPAWNSSTCIGVEPM